MFDFLRSPNDRAVPKNTAIEDESNESSEVFNIERLLARAEELARTDQITT